MTLQYKDHTERAVFVVMDLGCQDMILGISWLQEHNPEIDWQTGEVKMLRCPCKCSACWQEVKAEKAQACAEIQALKRCLEV